MNLRALVSEFASAAEPYQEMSDFRLEDDDDGEDSHVDEAAQQRAYEFHLQCVRYHSQDVDGNHRGKYVHCGGIAYPSEYEIDEQADQKDVQHIGK